MWGELVGWLDLMWPWEPSSLGRAHPLCVQGTDRHQGLLALTGCCLGAAETQGQADLSSSDTLLWGDTPSLNEHG